MTLEAPGLLALPSGRKQFINILDIDLNKGEKKKENGFRHEGHHHRERSLPTTKTKGKLILRGRVWGLNTT